MQLGAMTRKITYAGRWNYFKECAGNCRCPWKEGPNPVPTRGRFGAHGEGTLSRLSSLLDCTEATENLVLPSSVPSVTRRPHKNPVLIVIVMGTEQTLFCHLHWDIQGAISQSSKMNSSRMQRVPCHSQHNSQALYTLTKGQALPTQSHLQVPGLRVFPHRCFHHAAISHSAEAADIPELPVCTHHNGIIGTVNQLWQVQIRQMSPSALL